MSEKDTLRQFIQSLLAEYGETSDLNDDQSLVLSGLLDSLAVLRIVVFLEEEFGLNLADQGFDQNDFDSVNAIKLLLGDKGNR